MYKYISITKYAKSINKKYKEIVEEYIEKGILSRNEHKRLFIKNKQLMKDYSNDLLKFKQYGRDNSKYVRVKIEILIVDKENLSKYNEDFVYSHEKYKKLSEILGYKPAIDNFYTLNYWIDLFTNESKFNSLIDDIKNNPEDYIDETEIEDFYNI